MPRTKIPVPRHKLEDLYVRQGLSQTEVAKRLNVSTKTLGRRLREEGIALRPARKHSPLSRNQIRKLYLKDRLTMREIAEHCGTSIGWVQDQLKKHGVSSRSRGMDRRHRHELPVAEVIRLYADEGWPAAAVGRHFGVSAPLILRTVHEHGYPVRRPGPTREDSPHEVELVRSLYSDPIVKRVLKRHGIRKEPAGRTLIERFPKPLALSRIALRHLYLEAGLSSDHIELLTGQPRLRIRRWLRDQNIVLRPPGVPAPVLRRVWDLN